MHGAQQQVLEAYFAAVNGERYADAGALFAPDGVLVAPGLPPRIGPAEISPYFAAALRPYPAHHDQPTRVIHAAGTATVEIRFTGALAGGAPMTFDAVDVFDFAPDGRIARLLSVYDSYGVRHRLAEAQGRDDATARVRAAMLGVRRGTVTAPGVWSVEPSGPFVAPVVLVDLSGLAAAELRAGDALVVRTGGVPLTLETSLVAGLAALAADGRVAVGDAPGVAVGEHWDLEGIGNVRGAMVLVAAPGGSPLILR